MRQIDPRTRQGDHANTQPIPQTLVDTVAAFLFNRNTYGYCDWQWQLAHADTCKPAHDITSRFLHDAITLVQIARDTTGTREERIDRVSEWAYDTYHPRSRHTGWRTLLHDMEQPPITYAAQLAQRTVNDMRTRARTLINTVAAHDPLTPPLEHAKDYGMKTIRVNPMDDDSIKRLVEERGGRVVRLDTGDATLLDPLKNAE